MPTCLACIYDCDVAVNVSCELARHLWTLPGGLGIKLQYPVFCFSCVSGTHLAPVGLGRDRKVNSRPDNWWRHPWFADLLAQQKDPSTLWFYMDFTSVQNEARFFWKVTIPRGSV